ncbi:transcriptional activator xlnR [Geosmithia morbida]|uniref:Transcriptional activator xlnR n=1 Tax=Geosmithia morbida TaxID=1094350 RepID=A0A9P4YQG4_9HYPO|nr:transcriptional activator xlnR [Geosmithia morbida]KAF4119932.1 transcriptional activator xlnR [Geosmithia morbida]
MYDSDVNEVETTEFTAIHARVRTCGRCTEYGYYCGYQRQAKKRGRVALKDRKEATSSSDASPSAGNDPPSPADSSRHAQLPQARPLSQSRAPETSCTTPQPQQHLFSAYPPTPSVNYDPPGRINRQPSPSSPSASGCRYPCLEPLLPYTSRDIPISVVCDLFENYLLDPGASLFRFSSPYILTRVFRMRSLLGPKPRPTSPALLATVLWCCAQTADISVLLVPGARAKLTNTLYEMATYLISARDPDRWRRTHGGIQPEHDGEPGHILPNHEPNVDDVLTFILLCIGVSAGDFKSDCHKWWSKAQRLTLSMGLNRLDNPDNNTILPQSRTEVETQEEKRRVFWLLYSLDRHLALSCNPPLPESIWEALDEVDVLPPRVMGPPVMITGTGIFEYFLPLMVVLGDIIEVHHGQYHPRLGEMDKRYAEGVIYDLIAGCKASLESLAREVNQQPREQLQTHSSMRISTLVSSNDESHQEQQRQDNHVHNVSLVIAYSSFILHVLHVLFHGQWDAISMLDNEDDWITTPRFAQCAYHAIEASEAVAEILHLDPELTFMPYLFGIYLLHGSFILLLFADRMPQLGQNQSVEQACETIIRAHERNFRRVLRSTLYNVRGGSPNSLEEHRLARRQVLSLYRWNRGASGLGI